MRRNWFATRTFKAVADLDVTPLRVELARPAAHREMLETHFGCRAKFKASRNALVFRESDLERPFVTHNAELLAMLGPQLDTELNARQSRQTLGDQVKSALKRLLAGQRPTIRTVARQVSLSSRTLQRRLAESGVTFQQLLDEARRELARHYLGQSSLELNETAYLLGYEDPNSFFRAFHDWEGTSPGQWRSNHRLDVAQALCDSANAVWMTDREGRFLRKSFATTSLQELPVPGGGGEMSGELAGRELRARPGSRKIRGATGFKHIVSCAHASI